MSIFVTMKREPNTSNTTSLIQEGLKPVSINLPQLSFKNLEELINEAENLIAIQTSIEQFIQQLVIKLKNNKAKLAVRSMDEIIMKFEWDYAKYGQKMQLNLIGEAFKTEFTNIVTEYEKLLNNHQEALNKLQVENNKINGTIYELDIVSLALEKGINKDLEFLTQFLIAEPKDKKEKIKKVMENIKEIDQTLETIPIDSKNYIYVIYGMKSHEDEIIEKFQSFGFSIKKLTKEHKSLRDLKQERDELKMEVDNQTNILYTFMIGNIEILINILLHTLILKLWTETIMILGLPTQDYECFYLKTKNEKENVLKKLKQFYSKKGKREFNEETFCELKNFFKV